VIEITPSTIGRFVLATGAAVTWLMSGSVTQDAPGVRDAQPSVARPTDVIPPAQFTEVLRDRLREPATPERGRNPFTFGSRHAAAPRDAAPAAAEPEVPAAAAVEPPPPVFKLSGIAVSRQDGGTMLTAIVIDNGVMVFAKTGDQLSRGYSVVRVDETSITLVDGSGVTQTIRLP
jgi:hypothetical protein